MEPRPKKQSAPREARPYAKAAFATAKEKKAVEDWELKLQQLAEVMQDPELKKLPHDPKIGQPALKKIMTAVMDALDATEEQRNLVNLLIENKRLSLLPWIYEGFVEQRKRDAGVVDVTIYSAMPLTAEQVGNLKQTLKKRFNVASEPRLEVDPDLIGGIKLVIGDTVYDHSIKGQLERLKKHLEGPGGP